MVNIEDGLIDRLRNVYARDLIIEKVDETSPPAGGGARQGEGGVRGESVAVGGITRGGGCDADPQMT